MSREKQLENIAIVAKAYARVEGKELPSTYAPPVKKPETMYVLKEGRQASLRGLKKDYDLYPFEVFRPYVKEVRRDSQGRYYDLCDEFLALLRKS